MSTRRDKTQNFFSWLYIVNSSKENRIHHYVFCSLNDDFLFALPHRSVSTSIFTVDKIPKWVPEPWKKNWWLLCIIFLTFYCFVTKKLEFFYVFLFNNRLYDIIKITILFAFIILYFTRFENSPILPCFHIFVVAMKAISQKKFHANKTLFPKISNGNMSICLCWTNIFITSHGNKYDKK